MKWWLQWSSGLRWHENLKHFIRFFNFFDCSNQTSITSVRNEIFRLCKKYFEAHADSTKKSKTTNDRFWALVSHIWNFTPKLTVQFEQSKSVQLGLLSTRSIGQTKMNIGKVSESSICFFMNLSSECLLKRCWNCVLERHDWAPIVSQASTEVVQVQTVNTRTSNMAPSKKLVCVMLCKVTDITLVCCSHFTSPING